MAKVTNYIGWGHRKICAGREDTALQNRINEFIQLLLGYIQNNM